MEGVMSTSSRELLESFDHLPEAEKREVASEIIRRTFAFDRDVELDEAQLAALYAEFADDDRRLAEEGIEDYEKGLVGEDAR
jgi:flagellar motor switch protein FliG